MIINDQRPRVFHKTSCSIWTDPYILKQMLNEHLNPATDGATRCRESVHKVIDFISQKSKPEGRVLDLGCGPGIYSSLLHNKGFQVTGIDLNTASIDFARSRDSDDIRYLCGDYIRNYPEGFFDTAIMIYCDMGTHSDIDRDALINKIYHSLDEGGVFIFDVFTDEIIRDKSEGRSWEYVSGGGFWSGQSYLLLSQTFHYPSQKAFAYQYNLLTDEDSKHFIVWDRYYSPEEITQVVKSAGFSKVTIHTDILGRNNFTSSSEMFVVAEK